MILRIGPDELCNRKTIGQNIVPGPDRSVLIHGYTSKGVPMTDAIPDAGYRMLVAVTGYRLLLLKGQRVGK